MILFNITDKIIINSIKSINKQYIMHAVTFPARRYFNANFIIPFLDTFKKKQQKQNILSIFLAGVWTHWQG